MRIEQSRLGWWRSFRRRYNALLLITPLLVFPGVILLVIGLAWPAWKDIAWLAGGALLGAGFSALVATVTGSQAIHEQYAKEANVQRKQEIYGPLHSELKALRKRFEQAQQKHLPYPQAVGPTGGEVVSQGKYPLPTFQYWPQFKEDHRRDNFTEATQRELDHLHQFMLSYNAAMEATRAPTTQVLGAQITQAITVLLASEAYQRWWQANSVNGQLHQPPPSGDAPDNWFGLVTEGISFHQTLEALGQVYARYWLNTGGVFPSATAALGWLLAQSPDQAASEIQEWARHDGYGRRWHLPWLQAIFAETWAELQQHPAYEAVWKSEQNLFQQLGKLERGLEDALRYIRDQYEGGEPLA